MTNTIKVIDLLNKIANGEEAPKKIKFNEDIFEYYPSEKEYKSFVDEDRFCGQTLLFAVMYEHRINEILNCEAEIIEEQEEIDKLEIDDNGFIRTNNGTWKGRKLDIAFAEVINKLVKEVKNIKEKK